ncbi:MAG: hypothetical protein RQ743_11420 [Bacteroidales bacterium]|nr:hypothetical protein [Bacteroidales bacterium]
MQEYNNTDRQLHWLSQVIAKVNMALVPEKEDDSHTNFYFDAINERLVGRWVETPQGKILCGLNLTNLSLEWLNTMLQSQSVINILNKKLKELEQEVSEYPKSLGLNTDKIASPLHFEIPDYKIPAIQPGELTKEGITKWSKIRDLANNACLATTGYLQAKSEIRIWPHHFDTSIYSQVTKSLGIGFGLAMEDSMVGEPYFYLAGYSSGSHIQYKDAPKLGSGKWITGEHWGGAVLSLSEIYDLPSDLALEKIYKYVKRSVDWFLNL